MESEDPFLFSMALIERLCLNTQPSFGYKNILFSDVSDIYLKMATTEVEKQIIKPIFVFCTHLNKEDITHI